jgi:hypothetical protein
LAEFAVTRPSGSEKHSFRPTLPTDRVEAYCVNRKDTSTGVEAHLQEECPQVLSKLVFLLMSGLSCAHHPETGPVGESLGNVANFNISRDGCPARRASTVCLDVAVDVEKAISYFERPVWLRLNGHAFVRRKNAKSKVIQSGADHLV